MQFRDRRDAGRSLAEGVAALHSTEPVVLALPRGGIPVGVEVARLLDVTFDAFVARKLGAPSQPEYGIGAVAEGGVRVVDRAAAQELGLTQSDLDALTRAQEIEIARQVALYRSGRPLPDLAQRCVVLVDDGLATGRTAEAALLSLRQKRPDRLVLAVPVGALATVRRLRTVADDIVCTLAPESFQAVGRWYRNFDQVSDDQVVALLAGARGS